MRVGFVMKVRSVSKLESKDEFIIRNMAGNEMLRGFDIALRLRREFKRPKHGPQCGI
jgi:hypothetical protein